MHQRMIPFMYPVLEIIQRVPWVPNDPQFDLEKYQRTFFQEDGSKETLSVFSIVKDLRVLPQPRSYQRCLLAMHLARTGDPRREHEDGMQHTRILEAFSLMASQMFSNVQPGKLGHFAYVLQPIYTNLNRPVTNHLEQMDVRLLHATRSPWTGGLYYH